MIRRSAPRRRANLRPRKPIPAKNLKRRAKAFARSFHSKERVAFVKQLPCIITGLGPCENVHTESDGMGRRAHYSTIVPMISRCHAELHQWGVKTFVNYYGISLELWAARTESACVAAGFV